MKKSISSANSNRDTTSSRQKRIRSSTPIQEKENTQYDMDDDSLNSSSKKKVKILTYANSKGKKLIDTTNQGGCSTISASTPSGSNISFSLSSSKGATTTNNEQTTTRKSKPSVEPKEKRFAATQRLVDDNSVNTRKKTVRKVLTQISKTSNSSNTISSDNFSRSSDPQLKIVPSSVVGRENISSQTNNSSQGGDFSNLPRSIDLSLSTVSNDLDVSRRTTSPVHASIEGSLEYRELRRMYLHEKQQAQEWKKDYLVLKRHLEKVKATTIPRPTADVLDWLQELLHLINNNASYVGDGRDMKKVGQDLGLDEASLATVSARTPQKSSLKLFRLLFPTASSRAQCESISNVSKQILDNIYSYVRNLHKNLGFSKEDMRKALGTSIRNAKRDLRRHRYSAEQRLNTVQNIQENFNRIEGDEGIDDTVDTEMTFDKNEYVDDQCADTMEEGEDEDDDNDEDESNDSLEDEDEDGDKEMNNLMIDEELDDDDD